MQNSSVACKHSLKGFNYLLINYYCSEVDRLHMVVIKIPGGLCHSASYIPRDCLYDWLGIKNFR